MKPIDILYGMLILTPVIIMVHLAAAYFLKPEQVPAVEPKQPVYECVMPHHTPIPQLPLQPPRKKS